MSTVKVRDVLRAKNKPIISIKPTETIGALCQLLREMRIGATAVSADGKSVDGVISERDVAYGLATHKGDLHGKRVDEMMTKTVITCGPDDRIATVASTMMSRSIRHIPVVDEGRLVGMVSIRDVLNLRVDELQQQTAHLRTFVMESERAPQDRE